MKTIIFIPGAVNTPNPITIPAVADRMVSVVSSYIIRDSSVFAIPDHTAADVAGALAAHAAAAVIGAIADHTAIDVAGAVADHTAIAVAGAVADHTAIAVVGAIADHAAHGHDITMVAPAGLGNALTSPVIAGPIESVGGAATMTGAVDVLAAAQAHAAGAAPLAHAAGAAPLAHAAGAAPLAHAAGAGTLAHAAGAAPLVHGTITGANAVVACSPTRLSASTLSLSVNTLLGDTLVLNYIEVGAVLQVA